MAAKVLRLAHHRQIARMLDGTLGETPAMRAAVLRARERARRAFLMEPPPSASPCDLEVLRRKINDLLWEIQVLHGMVH